MSDLTVTQPGSPGTTTSSVVLPTKADASNLLDRWEQQIAEFSRHFEHEMSEIVEILTQLSEQDSGDSVSPVGREPSATSIRPQDDLLPTPSQQKVQPDPPEPAPATDTDRFSALKARLSQQLASAGQAAATLRSDHSDAEGGPAS